MRFIHIASFVATEIFTAEINFPFAAVFITTTYLFLYDAYFKVDDKYRAWKKRK
jgi:hypothetical protein